LEHLHRLRATHRGLSAESILATGTAQFALRDLGLAAVAFRPGEGPPGYQAPEQAFGARPARPGPATDVYQLAAIIYHLITGRVPGKNPTPARHPGLAETATDVISAALAARPADRPGLRDLRLALNAPRTAHQADA
jgi:serine/threonine protein kinase